MVLYNVTAIKQDLGETSTTNDQRIRRAGEKAQSDFETETSAVRDIDLILATPTNKEKELVNYGAIAWFYFIENGDDTALKKYQEEMLPNYVKKVHGRPVFKSRGAF